MYEAGLLPGCTRSFGCNVSVAVFFILTDEETEKKNFKYAKFSEQKEAAIMDYKKAAAEVIYFTNRDVITTSGGSDIGGCRTPGWDRGNGCNGTSGDCPGQAWK